MKYAVKPYNKYGNKKVEFQGVLFDSKKEMQRYLILLEAQRNGVISDLQRQVKFELIPAITEEYIEHLKTKDKVKNRTIQLAVNYICDFTYKKDGEFIIEDVKASKSMLTKEYLLKKKLLFAIHGLCVREIYKPTESV